MSSPIKKRSIMVSRHATSVSVEDQFWQCLKEIAQAKRVRLKDLIASVDRARVYGNLSSNLRTFVLDYYRNAAKVAASEDFKMRV